jgi:hypothetical protein
VRGSNPEADTRIGSPLILHPPAQPLRDGTIVVRLACQRDVEALVRYGDDPDVKETIWVPIPTPCTRAQAAERIDEFNRGWQTETRSGPALIIADAGRDEMIGIVLLTVREPASVELSYGVAAAHRKPGRRDRRRLALCPLVPRRAQGGEGRAARRSEQPRLPACGGEGRLHTGGNRAQPGRRDGREL